MWIGFAIFSIAAAALPEVSTEAKGIGQLGFDGKSFLFQVLNFFILLFILKKFAYRPILKALDERRKKIEQGLENARYVKQELERIEDQKKIVLQKARTEAKHIIQKASSYAQGVRKQTDEEAQRVRVEALAERQQELTEETIRVKDALRKDILVLVARTCEKVLGEKLNTEQDEKLILKSLQEAKEERV